MCYVEVQKFEEKYLDEVNLYIDTHFGCQFEIFYYNSVCIIKFLIDADAVKALEHGEIKLRDGSTLEMKKWNGENNLSSTAEWVLLSVGSHFSNGSSPHLTTLESSSKYCSDLDLKSDPLPGIPSADSVETCFVRFSASILQIIGILVIERKIKFDPKFTNLIKHCTPKLTEKFKFLSLNHADGTNELIVKCSSPVTDYQLAQNFQNFCRHKRVPVGKKSIIEFLKKEENELKKIRKMNDGLVDIRECLQLQDDVCAFDIMAIGSDEDVGELKKMLEDTVHRVRCQDKELCSIESVNNFEYIVKGLESVHGCKIDYKILDKKNYDGPVKAKGIIGSTNISIIQAPIQDEKVNIIVNSVPKSLNLSEGDISNCLLEKAGPKLQEECNKFKNSQIDLIGETSSYGLSCNKVYHCFWKFKLNTKPKDEELHRAIKDCLEKASGDKFQSIVFPPLGCGGLGMPSDLVASTFFKVFQRFLKKNPKTTLEDIRIAIINDKNEKTLEVSFNN
ncbi:hypothetical protein HELRODRAFT_189610 [Helobdella robusta]|uniref:Macro domain-containing protein n=1 Tax=Helobdella robusta TaxID=6412 RepID=T1FR73_HELRO|nr:hypothetical protein HELRODRAFT_189610 [Helobdella robusta]ESN92766.1 hypothetical protein HELRODRAFT_189610 [Helobdella robusta]